MGLAIGSKGSNIARARHIEGVKEVVYHQIGGGDVAIKAAFILSTLNTFTDFR